MASWWDELWGGKTVPVGQASDVQMINQGDFSNWQNQLKQMLGSFGSGIGLGTSQDGGIGSFDPMSALNAFMSQQGGLAQLANQNVSGALSDVYSTGRAQAQAAADQARRQAADDLAAAGLLQSGAGIGAMTKATAQPMMEMETNLANMRSQALMQQLGQLQGTAGGLLSQGYQTGAGLLGQILGEQGQANQPQYWAPQYRQTTGLGDLLPGLASMAIGLGTGNVGTGLSGLGGFLGNLFGQGQNQGPQYTPYQWSEYDPNQQYARPRTPTGSTWSSYSRTR